jgi:hypothetical protein
MRLIDPRAVTQVISRIGRAYRSRTTCILGAPKVPLPHLGRRLGPDEPEPREELQHTSPHRALHGGDVRRTEQPSFVSIPPRRRRASPSACVKHIANISSLAPLINSPSGISSDSEEAIADNVQARRVRKEVVQICERSLAANPDPTGNDASDSALKEHAERKYWVLATLAEAHMGLRESGPPIGDWQKLTP